MVLHPRLLPVNLTAPLPSELGRCSVAVQGLRIGRVRELELRTQLDPIGETDPIVEYLIRSARATHSAITESCARRWAASDQP